MKNFKIVTKRDKILGVADAFESRLHAHRLSGALKKLRKLDLAKCSEKDVTKIIGYSSWTLVYCNLCRKTVDAVIAPTDYHQYNSHIKICLNCAKEMGDMARAHYGASRFDEQRKGAAE